MNFERQGTFSMLLEDPDSEIRNDKMRLKK